MKNDLAASAKTLKIFRYNNYRLYLNDLVSEVVNRGISMRTVNSACKFNSSNYLKLVADAKRNLSAKTARQIAEGFGLSETEKKYFLTLVTYDLEDDAQEKIKILGELREQIRKASSIKIRDASIHSHWLNGVILELAGTPDFVLTADNVMKHLTIHTTKPEVESVIEFLIKRGFLKPTSKTNVYQKSLDTFSAVDDMRNIDLQQSHLRFLEAAKHKVNESIAEREFQGLTVAIPEHAFAAVKEEIRKFMDRLDDTYSILDQPSEVIRVQFAAYKLAKKPKES